MPTAPNPSSALDGTPHYMLPIPAPPQGEPTHKRGAHRSGVNTFAKPPPPTSFFASQYRTNTVIDMMPPALGVSQTNEERLHILLQSPRGLPKPGVGGAGNNGTVTSARGTATAGGMASLGLDAGASSTAARRGPSAPATPRAAPTSSSAYNNRHHVDSGDDEGADDSPIGTPTKAQKQSQQQTTNNTTARRKSEGTSTASTSSFLDTTNGSTITGIGTALQIVDSVVLAHTKELLEHYKGHLNDDPLKDGGHEGAVVSINPTPNTSMTAAPRNNPTADETISHTPRNHPINHKFFKNGPTTGGTGSVQQGSICPAQSILVNGRQRSAATTPRGTALAGGPFDANANSANAMGTTSGTGTASFLPLINPTAPCPRLYTRADPPAIVVGHHTKPQLTPRVTITSQHTITPRNRAAFGTIFTKDEKPCLLQSRTDAVGDGGVAQANEAARTVRNLEGARQMHGVGGGGSGGGAYTPRRLAAMNSASNSATNTPRGGPSCSSASPLYYPAPYSHLKPPVTPDLPDALKDDPIGEINDFDKKRYMQAVANGSIKVDPITGAQRTASGIPITISSVGGGHTSGGGGGAGRYGKKSANSSPMGSLSAAKPWLVADAPSHRQLSQPNLLAHSNRHDGDDDGRSGTPLNMEETIAAFGVGQRPEETDVGACKRDYQLTKVIFRAAKVHDTYPCRLLRDMGEARVLEAHQGVVNRLGYRRLNRDEFHNHIIDIVTAPEGSIMRKDTDAIFDLFDTNSSGFLDDREIVSGFHWIMQGPDETRRIIAAYCKQFLAARNVMEAVVSLMEVEIMAKAVSETCEERYPGVTNDAKNIVGFLSNHARLGQVSSLSGFVPYPLFYQVVQRSPIFGKVIRILRIDGTLPPELPRTRSPDPAREMRTMIHVAEALEDEPRRGAVGNGGTSPTGSNAPTGVFMGVSNNGINVGNMGNNGNRVGLIDCTHPRFKADACARQPGYRPTPEHDSPVWALRNGVLWLTNPTEGTPQQNTRKTSVM